MVRLAGYPANRKLTADARSLFEQVSAYLGEMDRNVVRVLDAGEETDIVLKVAGSKRTETAAPPLRT